MLGEDEYSVTQHLRALVREYQEMSETAEFYATLLPILHKAKLHAAPVDLPPDLARARLKSGTPLLRGVDLPIDDEAACRLLVRLARALENVPAGKAKRSERMAFARAIQRLGDQGELKAGLLLQLASGGHRDEASALAKAWQVDTELLWLLAQHALTSPLRQWARQLTPMVDESEWHQSRCFVCGAQVLLGELQGAEAAKHLRCGQCGADWRSRRLQCVFCGNDHLQTFKYMHLEAQPNGKRVEVCDECKGYLKVIVTLAPTPPEKLLLLDLATIHLDYIAQERGYVRGGSRSVRTPNPAREDLPIL
jgi:FdhE protein